MSYWNYFQRTNYGSHKTYHTLGPFWQLSSISPPLLDKNKVLLVGQSRSNFFSLHSLHKLLPFNSCDINDNNKQQQLQSVFNTVSALHSLSCCHVYDNPSYEEGSWNYHLRFFRWELRLKEDSELIEEVGFTLGTSWVILHSLSHASTWAQQE